MVRRLKLLFLRGTAGCGLAQRVLASEWRRRRLLILCYHGISLDDEHNWSPGMFLPLEAFERRLQWIENAGCQVLPLQEAVEKLYAGSLPHKAIALTFDDGFYGFHSLAWPALRRRGWPVTLYLTTYYCEYNRPVFDPAVSYLLWKSPVSTLDWGEVFGAKVTLNPAGRTEADLKLKRHCLARNLSGREKNEMLEELARRLNVDLPAISSRRILHLVNPDEVRQAAQQGADIQLHTHIHRVSLRRERFLAEIENNRSRIREITGHTARHFCYPGGFHLPAFPAWLCQCGVLSATTCQTALAGASSDRMLLPRLVDTSQITPEEFTGWLSGVSSFLPRRPYPMSEGQLLETPASPPAGTG